MTEALRWIQRFDNYCKAFAKLEEGVELASERELSEMEKEGVIQRFEYTQELSWVVIKDFYEHLGETSIQGSRDAFRMASERGLVQSGATLMDTIKSRNKTAHTYNEEIADEVLSSITEKYYSAFLELKEAFENQIAQRQDS